MDWSTLPDLAVVALLVCAFASVARHSHTAVSGLWQTGWILIALHFAAFIFLPTPGFWGIVAVDVGTTALAGAGILFMYASIPYSKSRSTVGMLFIMLGVNTIYITLICWESSPAWALEIAAALFGMIPLMVALYRLPRINHPLRWTTVGIYCALSIYLLLVQNHPSTGRALALDGLLFAVYFGCCIHFLFAYRGATAGAFITTAGFFAWASVFVAGPLFDTFLPKLQIESEVWNLPKYVVAVGMILLLLESQIEHNKYLALHDELTGLPNRRLFLDRLSITLERARRANSKAALLVVDLDHFKQVNDTLGHHVGDVLLQDIGQVFSSRVRRSDTVARTGGDEFSIILDEPTSRENARSVAQSLMELLEEPMQLGDQLVRVGASIGTAVFPDDAPDLEALCIAADLRMYDDKHSPKDGGKPLRTTRDNSLPVIQPVLPHNLQVSPGTSHS